MSVEGRHKGMALDAVAEAVAVLVAGLGARVSPVVVAGAGVAVVGLVLAVATALVGAVGRHVPAACGVQRGDGRNHRAAVEALVAGDADGAAVAGDAADAAGDAAVGQCRLKHQLALVCCQARPNSHLQHPSQQQLEAFHNAYPRLGMTEEHDEEDEPGCCGDYPMALSAEDPTGPPSTCHGSPYAGLASQEIDARNCVPVDPQVLQGERGRAPWA